MQQIAFQEHLAAIQFGPALRFLGKEPDRELMMASNTLFASAFFDSEASMSQQAKDLLVEVFPESSRIIEATFRQLYIPNSPWDNIYNLDQHEKIRTAAINRVKQPRRKPQANVRRK